MKYRIALFLLSFCIGFDCCAQAYCALRDPSNQIYELFPEANGYKSYVQTIDKVTQKEVSKHLPFTLHRKEFGRHTAYGVLHDGIPVGIIHSRSERSEWGLVEVVWAFDTHLKHLRDFRFQRCRDPRCEYLSSTSFREQLKDKTFQELAAMLSADSKELLPSALNIPEDVAPLAVSLIRSVLKTFVVTDLVYTDDIRGIKFTR